MRTDIRANAIILKDGKILLIHRKKDGDEYWVFPGGGIEEGESADEAITREVREETDLEVVSAMELYHADNDDGRSHPYYLVEVGDGKPKLSAMAPEDNNDTNWYNPEWVELGNMEGLKIYPAGGYRKFLELYRNGELS
jgi:8-oxo-dGTP diphosphatase